jgi:hypothetical protein
VAADLSIDGALRGEFDMDSSLQGGLSGGRFAALDFETADFGRDSACAVGVVVVDGTAVVDRGY